MVDNLPLISYLIRVGYKINATEQRKGRRYEIPVRSQRTSRIWREWADY